MKVCYVVTTPANFFPVGVQHSSRLATSVTSASTFPCVASIPTGEIFNTVTDTTPRPKQASEESARAPIPCLAHISERRAEKEGADCSGAKGARWNKFREPYPLLRPRGRDFSRCSKSVRLHATSVLAKSSVAFRSSPPGAGVTTSTTDGLIPATSHKRPNSQLLGPPPPLLWSPPPPKSPLSLLDAATRTVAPPLVITAVSWQPCLSSPYQITPVSLSKLYTKRSF